MSSAYVEFRRAWIPSYVKRIRVRDGRSALLTVGWGAHREGHMESWLGEPPLCRRRILSPSSHRQETLHLPLPKPPSQRICIFRGPQLLQNESNSLFPSPHIHFVIVVMTIRQQARAGTDTGRILRVRSIFRTARSDTHYALPCSPAAPKSRDFCNCRTEWRGWTNFDWLYILSQ